MPSIFSSPLSDIKLEDVTSFLALKEPEGLRLEYKEMLPENKNLAKSVAAMANAEGGIIIVGVMTDSQNRPERVVGVPLEDGLVDRVANICAARVRPVLVPEVRILEREGSPDCLLLVRVPSSNNAPHYLPDYDGEPLIPIRVDARIARADVPTVEALLQRRQGEVLATKRKAGRRDPPRALVVFKQATGRELTLEEAFSIRIIVYATGGPEKLCTLTHDLDEFLLEALPYECPFGTIDFDWSAARPQPKRVSGYKKRLAQDDVVFTCAGYRDENRPFCVSVRVTDMGAVQFGGLVLRDDFRLERLVGQIHETLRFAKSYYSRVGYLGDFEFEVFLEDVKPAKLKFSAGETVDFQSDQHIHIRDAFNAGDLEGGRSEIVKRVLRSLFREGNVPVAENVLHKLAAENR